VESRSTRRAHFSTGGECYPAPAARRRKEHLATPPRDEICVGFKPRYGLIPDLGGPHRLARLVGPSRAKEIIWSTRMVEAEEALRIGLVNRVVDPGVLRSEAEALARQVAQHSPTAVALVKELIERAPETPLEDEYEREAEGQTGALQGEDHREAVSAFLEGRPPRFRSS
jgi:enoyl-CoA hydratase/carnithine racemase